MKKNEMNYLRLKYAAETGNKDKISRVDIKFDSWARCSVYIDAEPVQMPDKFILYPWQYVEWLEQKLMEHEKKGFDTSSDERPQSD